MIHDDKHEVRQDEAIRQLAMMVGALAHRLGASDMANAAQKVDEMLAADEVEQPVEAPVAAAVETPAAEWPEVVLTPES